MHNNADGLSRCRQANAPPANDGKQLELVLEALEADWRDGNLEGNPTMAMVFCDTGTTPPISTLTTVQGPRQMLLEAAPCTACRAPFLGQGATSVICDRCNAAYHLKCAHL